MNRSYKNASCDILHDKSDQVETIFLNIYESQIPIIISKCIPIIIHVNQKRFTGEKSVIVDLISYRFPVWVFPHQFEAIIINFHQNFCQANDSVDRISRKLPTATKYGFQVASILLYLNFWWPPGQIFFQGNFYICLVTSEISKFSTHFWKNPTNFLEIESSRMKL